MSARDDGPIVERASSVLRALATYQPGDGEHAELLALLARPEVLRRIAKCHTGIRSSYAWLVAQIEEEIPLSTRRRRGRR